MKQILEPTNLCINAASDVILKDVIAQTNEQIVKMF